MIFIQPSILPTMSRQVNEFTVTVHVLGDPRLESLAVEELEEERIGSREAKGASSGRPSILLCRTSRTLQGVKSRPVLPNGEGRGGYLNDFCGWFNSVFNLFEQSITPPSHAIRKTKKQERNTFEIKFSLVFLTAGFQRCGDGCFGGAPGRERASLFCFSYITAIAFFRRVSTRYCLLLSKRVSTCSLFTYVVRLSCPSIHGRIANAGRCRWVETSTDRCRRCQLERLWDHPLVTITSDSLELPDLLGQQQ